MIRMLMQAHRQSELSNSLRMLLEQEASFRKVAYCSMEVAIKPSIPTYSGGLGVLAGDILKSAADMGVPMVGITMLYRNGYFRQSFDEKGWQKESPVIWNPSTELVPLPNTVTVKLRGRDIKIRAWVYDIHGLSGYTVPVYFLDTDVEGNHADDRRLSWDLYGGDQTYRLCQEMILGVGGLRMLRDLGYSGIETYHLNEGHAGFLTLELMREQGYFDPDKIKKQVIFTTHTPVPAGHDVFPFGLIERTLPQNFVATLRQMLPASQGVSMTELGYTFSRYVNAVSKRHAEVSRKMFDSGNVDSVTNGVHPGTWVSPSMKRLFDSHIPGWENDPGRLVQALNLPSDILWRTHQADKTRLIATILEMTGRSLDPDVLTIGFARRAAQYKRADLIFSDVQRLLEATSGKLQIVFSGKAHPKDDGGKTLLQRIQNIIHDIDGALSVVFLENYNMELASHLVQGVDLWLNTPTRPHEASGTSGMKCALNGIMSLSVLDGWWIEGWVEGATGWSIGPEPSEADLLGYDGNLDAVDLYKKLEQEVIPTYYDDRERWISMMHRAIALNGSYFNTHRVVKEYCEKAYEINFRGM
ncbi:MAG: alpha-glucan family phosphorylase [Synergistota bacterium]|nr:alpha-glucan family phosphorylase [Synergistota bacterium]